MNSDIEIEKIDKAPIDKFTTFPWNPRKKDFEKYEELKESIKQRGIITPVKVRKTSKGLQIWDGEKRLEIAKELDIEEIPYILYKGLNDDDKVKRIRLSTCLDSEKIDWKAVYEEWKSIWGEKNFYKKYEDVSKAFGLPISKIRELEKKYRNESPKESEWKQTEI